jgi:hypothetical protein
MSTRSRLLSRLAFAALLIVTLLWSCQSGGGQKPFRYSGPPLVEISDDCRANPYKVVVDVGLLTLGHPRSHVVWHVTGKQAGDRVVILDEGAQLMTSDQRAVNQASHDKRQGKVVPSPFQKEYAIPSSYDAIRSESPKAALKFLHNPKDSVVWTYSIEYYRNGTLLCKEHSPSVCIQKMGSSGCLY